MNNDNKYNPRIPWTTPQITTLSISRDTGQLQPPEAPEQS